MTYSLREYRSGTRYCIWRWKDVGYLLRLHVVQCPKFSICIHWIRREDRDLYLHDHPVSFLSVILRGGYVEVRRSRFGGYYNAVRRWFNFVRATDIHRIIAVVPGTVTLCFMGPKRREWGFNTPEGWIEWREYYRLQREFQADAIR